MAKEYSIGDTWVHPGTGITGKIIARHEVKNHVPQDGETQRFAYEAECPDLRDRDGKPSPTGTQAKIKTVTHDIDGKEKVNEVAVVNRYTVDDFTGFKEPAPVLTAKDLQDEVKELRAELVAAKAAIAELANKEE